MGSRRLSLSLSNDENLKSFVSQKDKVTTHDYGNRILYVVCVYVVCGLINVRHFHDLKEKITLIIFQKLCKAYSY